MESPDLWAQFRAHEQGRDAALAQEVRIRRRLEPVFDWVQLVTCALIAATFTQVLLSLGPDHPYGLGSLIGIVPALLGGLIALFSILPGTRVGPTIRVMGRILWAGSFTVLAALPVMFLLSLFLSFW
jgi:hypothetical protein